MTVYNIEVFDSDMILIHHEATSEYEYDFDYLTPVQSKIELDFHDSSARFIRIVSDDRSIDLMGVIVSLSDGELMEVGFKPFTSVLDVNIMFDTNDQGTGTLENIIKKYIKSTFVENSDALQNLPIGTIMPTSSTTTWGMNLKSDKEGQHTCKINLYDVLIANSFSNYGIVVRAIPNPTLNRVIDPETGKMGGTINISIGKTLVASRTIEIDHDSIVIKKFTVRDESAKVNKLIIYNSADYGWRPIIYYLHPDGTYGTTDTDRIFPVVPDVEAVDAINTDQGQDHAAKAQEAAVSKFGNMKFDNLIEIEVAPNDGVVKPLELKIGDFVKIVHNGIAYDSIVSGVKYGDLIGITFGMIRIDATKRFRRLLR